MNIETKMKATSPTSLLKMMTVELLVRKETGELVILYDKEMPAAVEYIEYDKYNHELYFICTDGQVFVLGAKIQSLLQKDLTNGKICVLIQSDPEGQLHDIGTVRLDVKEK